MTKHSPEAGHSQAVAPPSDELLPPAQRDSGSTCDLYAPGHQMHYRHQGDAARSSAMPVRETFLDGIVMALLVEDGRELSWRNHDPARLRRILGLLPGRCVIYPEHHAMRIGPYWFNCAEEIDSWQDCRLSRAVLSG